MTEFMHKTNEPQLYTRKLLYFECSSSWISSPTLEHCTRTWNVGNTYFAFTLLTTTLGFSVSPTISGNEEKGRVSKLFMLTWKIRGRAGSRTQVLCLDVNKTVIRTTLLCNRKSGLLRTAKWRFTNWANHAKKMSNCNNRFSYSCLPKEQRLGPLPSIDHKAHNYSGSTFQ